jgi:hypothetical protein
MTQKPKKRPRTGTTPSGTVITEDDAAQLGEQLEHDDGALDRGQVTFPRQAGRPSLTGRSAPSPQVTFRLSPGLRARAEKLAAERGTTVSGLARQALEELLQHSA